MDIKELEIIRKRLDLTISAFADLLHVSRQTYYNWDTKGEIPLNESKRIVQLLIDKNIESNYTLENNEITGILRESGQKYNTLKSEVKQVPLTEFMEAKYLPCAFL